MNTDELHRLIAAWLDGTITEADSGALEKELRDSSEARAEFRRWTELDAALREQAGRTPDTATAPVAVKTRRWFGWPAAGWLAAAASVAAMLVLRGGEGKPAREATSNGVAMLSQTLDAEFGGSALRTGDTITPGRITLNKGLAQIEFFSGATALIEGAAEIEILSSSEARCLRGRVRVHVPPAAKGFVFHAPGMKLEDLGTEFALNVDAQQQTSAVHVFEGEVIAHAGQQVPASLTQGMTLGSGQATAAVSAQDFLPISELHGLIKQRQQRRFEAWQAWSKEARTDPRLIAYYTFKHWADDRWDRLVNNFALPQNKSRTGGAVGARWTEGRWPGKEALEFKRPGDRVRMNLDGTYTALTLACWVKVDSVDKKYNSLLLTDGYDSGEPHWQIYEDGGLMFSISYPTEGTSPAERKKANQRYFTKPVFTADSLGRWHHLAVTYDNGTGTVVQYCDGQEVSREVSKLHQPGRPIVFGPCEIGNWGLPTQGHQFSIRNLNGAIDKFAIYGAVLSAEEVRRRFEAGKPE